MYINIKTERLIIRPITLDDADFIVELVNSEGWLKFIGDKNVADRNDANRYIQDLLASDNKFYNVIELKELNKAIGVVTFMKREDEKYPDFGFALLPEYEKKGLAFEASKAYLKILKSSNRYQTIIAIANPQNHKSINLLRKLGLEYKARK